MTDSDPAFTELLARFESARFEPDTKERLTSLLRQFWSELDRLHVILDDRESGLEPVLASMRTTYFNGLLLITVIERLSAQGLDGTQLSGAVGRCVELLGRRLGTPYQAFAVRCQVELPPHAVLGRRASA
jgi:hypothetical protein